MGLLDVIRSGIKVADTVTKDLQPTVWHHQWIRADGDGTPHFAPRIARQAIVEKKTRPFTSNGVAVESRHVVTFVGPIPPNGEPGRSEPIDERDRIILPDGDTGEILAVEEFIDRVTGRGMLTQVWLG